MASTKELILKCMATLDRDLPKLEKIDRYVRGDQDYPYMPKDADAEYKLLARRCITNTCEFMVGTPAQTLYVDAFRRSDGQVADVSASEETGQLTGITLNHLDNPATSGGGSGPLGPNPYTSSSALANSFSRKTAMQPEWIRWQKSRMDARQAAIYRAALSFGHSFVVAEQTDDGARLRGLSPLRTTAIYEDPANHEDPAMVFHVVKWPTSDAKGEGWATDDTYRYPIRFLELLDEKSVEVGEGIAHGADENPVTRFTAAVDLEGRTEGVVWPLIPIQDRINQTVFDLLVAQTYGSFKVRTVTGMAPPMKSEPVWQYPAGDGKNVDGTPVDNDGKGQVLGYKPVIGPDGKPVPEDIQISIRRLMYAEDPQAKFGTLESTALGGYIESLSMSFKHLAALSQIPPHFLLGQLANLSAEAIQAAEQSLMRRVMEFQASFGESWERAFRIAAVMDGDANSADGFSGEVIWRDTEQKSISQAGDALGKLSQMLGIPGRGLWARVPGVTAQEMQLWEELREQDDAEQQMAASMQRAVSEPAPTYRDAAKTTPPSTTAPRTSASQNPYA